MPLKLVPNKVRYPQFLGRDLASDKWLTVHFGMDLGVQIVFHNIFHLQPQEHSCFDNRNVLRNLQSTHVGFDTSFELCLAQVQEIKPGTCLGNLT